jgi:hypothetical protein
MSKMYKDGEFLDPLAMSQDKYSKNCVVIDPDALAIAEDTIVRKMQERNARKPFEKISYHDALSGYGNLTMLNRSSYSGLEESLLFNINDKKAFMGEEGPVDVNAPLYGKMKSHVEDVLARVIAGENVTAVFDSIPKDEVLPCEKVDVGKVRVIAASSVVLGIITRMYYGQVQDTLVDEKNKIRNGRAMGINPYGNQWTTLAHKMMSDLPDGPPEGILEYDFKGYDGSLSLQYMKAAFRVLDRFIPTSDPEAITVRAWICEQTCMSVHRSGSEYIQMTGSNPSGNFLTTILNDTVQEMAILLATSRHVATNLRDVVGMEPYRPASEFIESPEIYEAQFNVYDNETSYNISLLYDIITYGDDGLMTVSPLLEYDTKKLASAAYSQGFELTNGDKTIPKDNPQAPKDLSECTFLQRGFRLDGTVWRAPLNIKSIYQSLGWKRKGSTEEDRAQVYPNALLEFALHGKKVYDLEAPALFDVYMADGRNPVSETYEQVMSRVSSVESVIY